METRNAQREGRLGAEGKQAKVPSLTKALTRKVAKLAAKNARLEKSLDQAELVIVVQKDTQRCKTICQKAAFRRDVG